MKSILKYITVVVVLTLLLSCEKEVDVNIPNIAPKLVVEGKIELNTNPIIILTKTTGYFDPTDLNSVAASFVDDATITISDGTSTNNMTKICSGSLTPPQQEALAQQLGIAAEILQSYNICGYTDAMIGEEGKTYTININWQGETYSSATQIPTLVPLDSVWFKVEDNLDSLGFAWALLSDPTNVKNYYRWYTKRINHYTFGDYFGKQKDDDFIAPSGSSFNDEFFNGLTFDFAYNRKSITDKADDKNNERSYFKVGDTIAIKFCTIDKGVYQFLNQAENQVLSTGSPFASPSNIQSNVNNGALGIWAGYGITYDTIIAK
jgi:hypothetical protein